MNQTVSGLAITILAGAAGLSSYLASTWDLGSRPGPAPLSTLDVFGLDDAPVVGPLLFNQNVLTYLSWVARGVPPWYLFRTRAGLNLRAVGESPATADAMGINVTRYRYIHTLVGGALAGRRRRVLPAGDRPDLGRRRHRRAGLDRASRS